MAEPAAGVATLTLREGTLAPSQARQFVEARLVGIAPALVFDVTLAVSELVTNVVRHGSTPAQLELLVDGGCVRVLVRDAGAPFDRDGEALPSSESTRGRGLFIVAALARDWGITSHREGGKTVWFEVATG